MNNNVKEAIKQSGITTVKNTALVALITYVVGECTETVRQVLREEGSTLSYEDADKLQRRMKEFFGIK